MTATMTTPQLLRATADHLRTYGWVQGRFYEPKLVVKPVEPPRFVQDVVSPMHIETVIEADFDHAPACMLGALAVTSGAREHLQYNGQQMLRAGDMGISPVQAYHRAVRVLEKTITEHTQGRYRDVAGYNDSSYEATLTSVLELLEAAAQRAEETDVHVAEMRKVMQDSMAATMAAMNTLGANIAASAEALKAAFAALETTPEVVEPTPELDAVMTLEQAAAVVDAAVEAVAA